MALLQRLADLLFPPHPESITARHLSVEILQTLRRPSFHPRLSAISAFRYDNPQVKQLIWAIKYRRDRHAANHAAFILYPLVVQLIRLQAKEWSSDEPWSVIPIPSSPKRERERGYNQSLMIAQELLNYDKLKMMKLCTNILVKIKNTSPQSKLANKKERQKNLIDCFSVTDRKKIGGKRIILIDDVITTGSTMAETRRTLLDAGAKVVLGASLAWQELEKH